MTSNSTGDHKLYILEGYVAPIMSILRQPGWAKSVDTLGDAHAALQKFRAVFTESGLDARPPIDDACAQVVLDDYELDAVKLALETSISAGNLGLGNGTLDMLAQFGIKPTPRKNKK